MYVRVFGASSTIFYNLFLIDYSPIVLLWFLFFFFFSSRRRHTRSVSAFLLNRSSDLTNSHITDAFSRSGWLWPVDAKGEPLKATSYMAVGFYVAKYVNKKSDMDLAAKGLGAKEWNNRSEERRVGKECMSRWVSYNYKG